MHLYDNRQLAFEHSRYRWIVRGDSDFIAWNSGFRDIRNLRKLVLNTRMEALPVGFEVLERYVLGDWRHTRPDAMSRRLAAGYISAPPA